MVELNNCTCGTWPHLLGCPYQDRGPERQKSPPSRVGIDEEQLKRLRALGVKSVEIHGDGSHFVEFFEQNVPSFGSLDLDTIAPPAHGPVDPHDERDPRNQDPPKEASTIPSALRRLLEKGSVS